MTLWAIGPEYLICKRQIINKKVGDTACEKLASGGRDEGAVRTGGSGGKSKVKYQITNKEF